MATAPSTSGKPKRLLLIVLVLLAVAVGAYVVRVNTLRPNTNDAYAYAESVRVIPEV